MSTMTVRIAVVGEALVDVFETRTDSRELPGGSPANVAVALGRLGHRPSFLTQYAQDASGRAIDAWLAESHVEVMVTPPPSGRTSRAIAVIAETGDAEYVFDLDWDIAGAVLPDAPAVVHTGSIATVLHPGAERVYELLREHRDTALLSFDPNARPAITPDRADAVAQVERLARLVDVIKVSDDDLAWYYPGTPPRAAAQRWLDDPERDRPLVIALTRGEAGVLVLRAGDEIAVQGERVAVADTIAAGDTFTGALLDALIALGAHGPEASVRLAALSVDELRDAARWATAAAAITVSRPGANPPWRSEMPTLNSR